MDASAIVTLKLTPADFARLQDGLSARTARLLAELEGAQGNERRACQAEIMATGELVKRLS